MTISAATRASNLVTKYNSAKNDNTWFSGWTQSAHVSRVVLSKTEGAGIIKELRALPAATAKRVLNALADRIASNSLHLEKTALPDFQKLAKELGVTKDLVGKDAPPMIMG